MILAIWRSFFRKHVWSHIQYYVIYILRIGTLLAVPLISKHVLDVIVPSKSVSGLIMWVALAVVMQIGVIYSQLGAVYFSTTISTKLKILFKRMMLAQYLEYKYNDSTMKGTGYIVRRIEHDVELLAKFLTTELVFFAHGVIVLVGSLIIIYSYNILLLATTMLSIPLFVLSMTMFNKKITVATTRKNEAIALSSNHLSECILGRNEIREYSAIGKFLDIYRSRQDEEYRNTIDSMKVKFKPGILGQFSSLIGKVALLGVGGYGLMNNTLTFGEYFAFSVLVQYLLQHC